MIKKNLLGRTSYGGEIYLLEADEPYEIPALRCIISFGKLNKKEASVDDAIEYFNQNSSNASSYANNVYSGQKHRSIGECSNEGIYLKNVSRLLTFLGWMPIGAPRCVQGVGTEKSLRRTRAKGFVDNGENDLKKLCENAFELYEQLIKAGCELEDARYVLPLATQTEEIIQLSYGRYLGMWANYLCSLYFKEAKEVGEILRDWNLKKSKIEVDEVPPKESYMPLLAKDELPLRKQLKSIGDSYNPSFDTLLMNVEGSIASFHEEARNRQERILWPSWEEVVKTKKYFFPRSIKSRETELQYVKKLYNLAQELGEKFWEEGKKESAILAQLLAKEIHAISTIHGKSNIAYTFELRTCYMAQEEIRKRFMKIKRKVEKSFGSKLGPSCETKRECYEKGRKNCPRYNLILAKAKK